MYVAQRTFNKEQEQAEEEQTEQEQKEEKGEVGGGRGMYLCLLGKLFELFGLCNCP